MSNRKWIGAALGLALCTTALASCQQASSTDNGSAPAAGQSGITLDNSAEKQIRDAISQAPKHGLKPDLFLKGGEKGEALVQAGLKYASALANGTATFHNEDHRRALSPHFENMRNLIAALDKENQQIRRKAPEASTTALAV